MTRKYTKKLFELIDNGCLDEEQLVKDLLNWLSESDVKQFYKDSNFDEYDELEDYDPILDKND